MTAWNLTDCTFRSGKLGVSWDQTNPAGVHAILTKDSTNQIYYCHYIAMAFDGTGMVKFLDGSGANAAVKIGYSVPTAAGAGGAPYSVVMDFKNDPLVICKDTSYFCTSVLGAAGPNSWGFMKYEIGLGKPL